MSYLPIPIPTFTTYIHVGRGLLCTKKPISKSKKTSKGGTVHKTSIPNIGRVVLRSKYRIQGDNTDKHLLDNNTLYLFITTYELFTSHMANIGKARSFLLTATVLTSPWRGGTSLHGGVYHIN